MRIPMILHAAFIFFSCLSIMPLSTALIVPSIILFHAGMFAAFLVLGRIYLDCQKCVPVFSTVLTCVLGLAVACLCWVMSLVTVAVSVLDVFFVLQPLFWLVVLRPVCMGDRAWRGLWGVCGLFVVSVVVVVLSFFTWYVLLYGAVYALFCVVLGFLLEGHYG